MKLVGGTRRLDPRTRLRASPDWELTLLDRLGAGEQASLAPEMPAGAYGILRRRDGSGRARAAGPDAALLFLTLREPCTIPRYVHASFEGDAEDAVAELVADGVLEAEVDGRWAAGPSAFSKRAAAGEKAAPAASRNADGVAQRSRLGLRLAAELRPVGADGIERFLYRFGATPLSLKRERRWSDAESIYRDLRLQRFPNRPDLSADSAWWVFPGKPPGGLAPSPKLYGGVAVRDLNEALERLAALWAASDAVPPFKIGATVQELHRPDRMVFYPATWEEAADWAARLEHAFQGLAADPVPFTAAVGNSQRVTWGADPRGDGWRTDHESWRSHVARTLAAALVEARAARETDPCAWAAERARLAGIDAVTWQPLDARWNLRQ
jgi:hypothetical protein